jgi:hypothetical protein
MQRDLEDGKARGGPQDTEQTPLIGRDPELDKAQGGIFSSVQDAMFATDRFASISFGVKDETVTTYDPETLTGWRAIFTLSGTIFSVRSMWSIIGMELFVMSFIALCLFRYVKDPHAYQTETMSIVVKTISVLIGFMLGLFLSSSLDRWWDTVKSVQQLFGVIKKLIMLASSLEIRDDQRATLARRGVLSVRMLETELTRPTDEMFKKRFDELQEMGKITNEERALLEKVPLDQRSFFTWILISNYLKQFHNLMDPISYDRIVTLVLDGLSAVSSLRTLLHFQFPFIYMHMLAFMVHMANFLTAIGTGVTLGLLFARTRADNFRHADSKLATMPDPSAIMNEVLFFLVQAFFYQAFLSIGAALSFPVATEDSKQAYRLPIEPMVQALDRQLTIMNELAGDAYNPDYTPRGGSPAAGAKRR